MVFEEAAFRLVGCWFVRAGFLVERDAPFQLPASRVNVLLELACNTLAGRPSFEHAEDGRTACERRDLIGPVRRGIGPRQVSRIDWLLKAVRTAEREAPAPIS